MTATSLPELAKPAQAALREAGIHALEDLSLLRRDEVAGLRGVGPKAMDAIDGAMAAAHMRFRL